MEIQLGKNAADAGRNVANGGKPSVLIVDDERNTREGLAMALRREWSVRTAESKDAALARLAEAGVKTLDDLADLAVDLLWIHAQRPLDPRTATTTVMISCAALYIGASLLL